jgi:anti-anti-sigma regulatory factor
MTRLEKLLATILVAAVTLALVAFPWLEQVECLRSGPDRLRWLTIAGEAGIATAYAWIPARLVLIWLRLRVRPHALLLVLYGAFIVACGITHAIGIMLFWLPLYWVAAKVKVITAAISLAVAYVTEREQNALIGLGEQGAAIAKERDIAREARDEADAKNAQLIATIGHLDEQVAIAELQRRTIQGLSIPLLQIGRGVVLVPLIGVLDSERAAHLTAALLAEVADGRAEHTLLDVTGVEAIDTATAKHMIDLVRAVGLMGGVVLVTGVQPAVSQTMVSLGIDLGVSTFRTIEKGLAALQRKDN